jgi:hypothetical protein
MSNNVEDLRAHLFEALAGLKNGTIKIEQAKAMSEIAQTIINTAKVEVDYAKATGHKGSTFLEKKTALPAGISGITQHRLRG